MEDLQVDSTVGTPASSPSPDRAVAEGRGRISRGDIGGSMRMPPHLGSRGGALSGGRASVDIPRFQLEASP